MYKIKKLYHIKFNFEKESKFHIKILNLYLYVIFIILYFNFFIFYIY